jgi:hypothetical protein
VAAESFFTLDSFTTVAGSAAAIMIITNAIRRATRLTTPVIPLIASLFVGFLAAGAFANKLHTLEGWFLAFLNSCLLFCTAVGGQEVAANAGRGEETGGVRRQSSKPLRIFSSWLRPDEPEDDGQGK